MLARKQELNLQFQQVADGVLLLLAFWVAYLLRSYSTNWFGLERSIASFGTFKWVLFLLMPFGPIILETQGFYNQTLHKSSWRSLGQLARSSVVFSAILAVCWFFFRLDLPSRAVLLIFAGLAAALLIARQRVTVFYFKRKALKGRFRENVLLAGVPADMQDLESSFTTEQRIEMRITTRIDIESQPTSALIEALHRHSISRVIFAGGHGHLDRLQDAIAACEIEGVEAWLVADFIKTSIARPEFDVMGNRPMLVFRTTPGISWALLLKSTIDRVGAVILLVPCSVVMAAAAVAINMTSPGPIIFRQQRAGRHGQPFTMFKFRTMVTDAEMQRAELMAYNQMSGPVFKITRDPRVTPVGHILRKLSIDEFPQLINVLQGHMSLVGPRPLPIYEVEKFENAAQRRRLSVKPGLTCLWQVGGRNNVKDFHEWVRLDLEYIDNWSIWLDLKILMKTVPVVLFGWGAK